MYKLHKDTDAFKTIISRISTDYSILPEIIEKDYYVTLLLQEVLEKQECYDVFFKGGTALYKALKKINRFSEDIDLTFNDSRFNTTSAKHRALKKVTSQYKSLLIDPNDSNSVSGSGSRTSVYTYSTLFVTDILKNDTLNRIGKVKVETTSFTTSSPVAKYEIEPILYTNANEKDRKILREEYEVDPFYIDCISIQRIFIDKLYAVEDYYLSDQSNRFIEMAKHMYDIHQLFALREIKEFLASKEELENVIKLKEDEQIRRIGAKTIGKRVAAFEYFDFLESEKIIKSFDAMQNTYVFNKADFVEYITIGKSLTDILAILK